MLSHSNKNGMVFSADKFHFIKEEVEFLRSQISQPKNEFKWDESEDEAFVASKKETVRRIEEGVSSFDPELTTCLSPDYSTTGMGWILQQKTCKCTPVTTLCCKTGWSVVLAGGRFCNTAQAKYSPTEGEATACAEKLRTPSTTHWGARACILPQTISPW